MKYLLDLLRCRRALDLGWQQKKVTRLWCQKSEFRFFYPGTDSLALNIGLKCERKNKNCIDPLSIIIIHERFVKFA
jgi:hypothetical protein